MRIGKTECMNRTSVLLIGGLFLVSLVFVPLSAGDTSMSRVSVSGNNSHISEVGNGSYQVILDQVNPNATVIISNKTVGIPLKDVLPETICTAAILPFETDGNQTVFMVQASEPLYSAENQTISWTITPQQYYDGTLLTEYRENQSELQPGDYATTVVYLECAIPDLENTCHQVCIPDGGGCYCA